MYFANTYTFISNSCICIGSTFIYYCISYIFVGSTYMYLANIYIFIGNTYICIGSTYIYYCISYIYLDVFS